MPQELAGKCIWTMALSVEVYIAQTHQIIGQINITSESAHPLPMYHKNTLLYESQQMQSNTSYLDKANTEMIMSPKDLTVRIGI